MLSVEELGNLFAATVNQETLETASELMVDVSYDDFEYHQACINIFDSAIESCKGNDMDIIKCINRSGYKVNDFESALTLLKDFKKVYLTEYVHRNS